MGAGMGAGVGADLGTLLPVAVLVGTMLCIMAARVAAPFGQAASGKTVVEHRLDVRERALLHRRSLYALGLVLLGGALTGLMPRGVELVGVAGAIAIVCGLPAVYRVTEEGIAFNTVVFRRWSELTGVEERRDGLQLVGAPGQGSFSVLCLRPETRDRFRRVADRRMKAVARQGAV